MNCIRQRPAKFGQCEMREIDLVEEAAILRRRNADADRKYRQRLADRRARNAVLREICGTSARAARADGGF